MKKPDYSTFSRVHCIGIGGIGLSGLARFLKARGVRVTGSDAVASTLTSELCSEGIPVHIGHHQDQITKDLDVVIYSYAVLSDDPERHRAKQLNIQQLSYPEAVMLLSKGVNLIAVCGTHGKSTVTSLLGITLAAAGLDPSVIVGTKVPEFGNMNMRAGKGDIFVVEACEYRKAFLLYRPHIAVVLNIEPDHLDYYKTFQNYRQAFLTFVQRLPEQGMLVANFDDPIVKKIVEKSHARVVSFACLGDAEYTLSKNGILRHRRKAIGKLKLKVPGKHNRMNALAVFACAHALGVSVAVIQKVFRDFCGTWRRLEFLGKKYGVFFYDDYAHHPTEIRASLQALREKFPKARVRCVFQPHQHYRTKVFLSEFAQSFSDASEVIVPNIYAARECRKERDIVSAEEFVAALSKHHRHVRFGGGLQKTATLLRAELQSNDVLVTMGAGDIGEVAQMLMKD